MTIVEGWQDHRKNIYAIVKHNQLEQVLYDCKAYEALWLDDVPDHGQLAAFGGMPGYYLADFTALSEAQSYLLAGITHEDSSPNIWWEMLAMSHEPGKDRK